MKSMHRCFVVLVLFLSTLVSCGGSGGSGGSGGGSSTFLSQLTVSQDGAFVGDSTVITARATLNASSDSVVLERVSTDDDDTAALVSELGEMYDDGDASAHGDDIAGDNVYSALITVTESEAGFIYARVNAGGSTSDIKTIAVHEHMTDAEWTLYTDTVPDAVQSYFDANGAAATVAHLNAGNVAGVKAGSAAVSQDGDGVSYVMSNGILGGIMPSEIDAADASSGTDLNRKGGRPRDDASVMTVSQYPPMELFSAGSDFRYATESVDADAVQSKSAIYVGPYLWDFGANDDYNGAWGLIKNSQCPKFETTEIKNDAATDRTVTPETFKTLSKYGLVVISTHGDNWYNGLFTTWNNLWGDAAGSVPVLTNPFSLTADLSWPVLLTNYKAADDTTKTYENDLLWHRIAITGRGTYAITPAFIRYYNGTFPESVVYISACRSMYNNVLAQAFTDKGAGAVFGYTDYVYAGWAKRHGSAIFGPDPLGNVVNSLLPLTDTDIGKDDVQTIADAIDESTAEYGSCTNTSGTHGSRNGTATGAYDAVDTEPACLSLYPSAADKNLNVAAILNGGFEEGSVTGWEATNDYRTLAALGDVSPVSGSYMGVISTGLGTYGNSLTASTLTQTMCIPAGATTITYSYDMITEEAMCYVGSSYDDTFTVSLLDEDGVTVETGTTETVNTSSWEFLGGDYFSGGDSYSTPETCQDDDGYAVYSDGTYHTGWMTGEIDVSAYAGSETPYVLQFNIYDLGDSAWDSAATLDEIELNVED